MPRWYASTSVLPSLLVSTAVSYMARLPLADGQGRYPQLARGVQACFVRRGTV
jgi:hypothetical protein